MWSVRARVRPLFLRLRWVAEAPPYRQGLDVESDDDALFPAGSDADETDRLTLGEVLVSVTAVRGTLFDAFVSPLRKVLQAMGSECSGW
jgi:hypothetical protein